MARSSRRHRFDQADTAGQQFLHHALLDLAGLGEFGFRSGGASPI